MVDFILICDSFSSANYHVMTCVIRSLKIPMHIHAIADTNEDVSLLEKHNDVTFYPIYSWRISFIRRIQQIKPKLLSRLLESLFFRATNHINNFYITSYERAIYSTAQKVVRETNAKAVFSVCFRFYDHRIAMRLARNENIQWFQFWLDPYSNRYDQHSRLWRFEAELLERKFFSSVSAIYALPEVFSNNRPIADYRDKLISFQIPYLINREVSRDNKHIIFAGSFVRHIREPKPVLDILLSTLDFIDDGVVFDFYIPDKNNYQSYTDKSNGRIIFHDYVKHDVLYSLLSNCYMLLNIGNYGTHQMPSKTVEYVSFRKPILFFHKGANDSSLTYLRNYPDVCKIDVDNNFDSNIELLSQYIRGKHPRIEYEELIKVQEFFESTPEYIRSIIKIQ